MTETLENKTTFFISNDVIYGIASGVLNTHDMMRQTKELIKKGKEENIRRFLFDHRSVKLDLNEIHAFHFSNQLKELGLNEDDKIAVLLPSNPFFDQWYSSFETSSVFQGNKIKIFNDEDAAVQWLKQ